MFHLGYNSLEEQSAIWLDFDAKPETSVKAVTHLNCLEFCMFNANFSHGSTHNLTRFAAVFLFIASISALNPKSAAAYLTLDADAGERYSDNITNASSSSGKKSDSTTFVDLSAGTFNVIGEYTGLKLALNFREGFNATYGGLNVGSSGLSLGVSQKFGLGPEAVRASLYLSGSRDSFVDRSRDVNSYKAGFNASKWFGETLKFGIGYEYDKRDQLNTTGSFCIGLSCYNDNVFAVAGNTGILNADLIVTEDDMLSFSYRHRQGDVTSVDAYTPAALGASSAYAADKTFGGLYAYRLAAVTDSISVGVSHELLRKLSLNLDYTYYTTGAGDGIRYEGNLFNFLLAYSM
jgi:hypothetical protein